MHSGENFIRWIYLMMEAPTLSKLFQTVRVLILSDLAEDTIPEEDLSKVNNFIKHFYKLDHVISYVTQPLHVLLQGDVKVTNVTCSLPPNVQQTANLF